MFERLIAGLFATLAMGAPAIAAEEIPVDPSAAGQVTDDFGMHAADQGAAMLNGSQPLLGWLVALPIILPLLGAGLAVALRGWPKSQAPIALVTLGLTLFSAVGLSALVSAQGPMFMAMGNWLPPFGIVITIDALSALMVLATSLVGLIGLSYARRDVDDDGVSYGFYSFYLLLICGVNGAFSTGDIFNLYVWFEVFLIASFGLMILGGTKIQLDGAVKYGVLNLIATTIFLIAVGALYGATGTLNMADLKVVLDGNDKAPFVTIAALFVVAFAMKAAAFPLHFWLPASYHTPKVIVSALFAGLLTKVGIYALMRITVMLFGSGGGNEVFLPLLVVLGVLTSVIGAVAALAQTNLKRMAGFLVISGIGVMLIGIGLGSLDGLAGAIVYAVHSIFAMTGLFLILGVAERLSGKGSLLSSGGLYSAGGLAASLFLVFGFAASGLPPFSGFWPKLILIGASLDQGGTLAILGAVGVIVSGFLTTLVVGRAWVLAFLKPREGEGGGSPGSVDLSVLILAALVIGLGLFPSVVIDPATVGAAGLLDPSDYVSRVLEAN